MEYLRLVQLSQQRWNRKILNFYWIVLPLSILIECVPYAQLLRPSIGASLLYVMVLPTALLAIALGLSELCLRMTTRFHDYLLLLCGNLIATVLIAFHPYVPAISALMLLPTLVSLFYVSHRKAVISGVSSVLIVILLDIFEPTFRAYHSLTSLIVLLVILVSGCGLVLEIIHRFGEILKRLQDTLESNQSLLIRNTLVESASKLDGLTGAYNHKSFHEHLDALIAQSAMNYIPIQLMIIDIDNFKSINDTFGHHIGDIILKRISIGIKSQLAPNDFLARYGGEEFAVVMVEGSAEQAQRTAEKIRETIAATKHIEIGAKPVTVSIGVCHHVPGQSKESLFATTDSLLYRAKQSGKNRTCSSVFASENA